jgi:hypothetical protein
MSFGTCHSTPPHSSSMCWMGLEWVKWAAQSAGFRLAWRRSSTEPPWTRLLLRSCLRHKACGAHLITLEPTVAKHQHGCLKGIAARVPNGSSF